MYIDMNAISYGICIRIDFFILLLLVYVLLFFFFIFFIFSF